MLVKINDKLALTIFYVVTSIIVLYTIAIEDVHLESIFKLISLVALSFLYVSSSKKINFSYVTILLISIISDVLLAYNSEAVVSGAVLLIINRILYVIIVKDEVLKVPVKILLFYSLPFLVSFLLLFFMLIDSEYSAVILIYGIFSVVMAVFAFVNYINTKHIENLWYFIAIFMIIVADALVAISTFQDYKVTYVVIYTFLYVIARYLICKAMILKSEIEL